MSIKAALQCLKKLNTDRKFKSKFSRAKTIEGKLEAAKAAGFSFTTAELKRAREQLLSQLDTELLGGVSGGGGTAAGCAAGNAAPTGCAHGASAQQSCSAGPSVSSGGACHGGGGQKTAACEFGSGDTSGNMGEMASEGIAEVVEMAEL